MRLRKEGGTTSAPPAKDVMNKQLDTRIPDWAFRQITDGYFLGFLSLFCLSLLLAMIYSNWLSWIFCGLCAGLFGLVIYFFRDPMRVLEDRDPHLCYSPADGRVADISPDFQDSDTGAAYVRIGIFLSVLDVHVQRSPLQGKVDFVTDQAGMNHPAYDLAASSENAQISMGIQTAFGLVVVKQIAGIMARKCVNFAKPGLEIQAGQRYGLIKFGSRVELFLPPGSKILIKNGDQVNGGLTPIAEMNHV